MPHDTTPDRADAHTARALLTEANRDHGTRFRLTHRLDGGFQSGTWLLTDTHGQQAVLKWSPNTAAAPQVLHAADVVARVRAAGYPTPAWLAVGVSQSGFPYQIQQFIPGRPASRVDAGTARLLIDLLESQAGLDPNPDHCWSQYVTTRLTHQRDEMRREVTATGPAGRDLLDACERLLAAHEPVTLPTGDLVHGDFRPGNILLDAGRVSAVIDIEALGSGSRVFDYATLLSADELDPTAQRLITAAGQRVAGPGPLACCFAVVALDLALFVHHRNLRRGIDHLPRLRDRIKAVIP
ncbi:phosphotransferase family protein [Streptomyces radicis]|nr:aminoglycoside phosphotransferase family protein [Streptomyces radicis]